MSVPDWMIDTPSPSVDDMAAVIRQLVRSLRKASPDNEVAERALDYLKRHGLQGSPLRTAPAPAVPAAGEQPVAYDAVRAALVKVEVPTAYRFAILDALGLNKTSPSAAGADEGKDAALIAAGGAMANICFNLKQMVGEKLTAAHCASMAGAQKAWDAARAGGETS